MLDYRKKACETFVKMSWEINEKEEDKPRYWFRVKIDRFVRGQDKGYLGSETAEKRTRD